MTKDEAINKLIRIRQVQGPRSEAHEALGMAIDALSQLSLPECLEEAAEGFIKEIDEKYGLWPGFKLLFKQAITFGAKWMAGQGVTFEDEVCELYDKLYLYYIDDCSSMTPDTSCEMLKELGASKGDKVIVQIRKKEG